MSFKVSSRFAEAAAVMGTLPVDRFELLLGRIVANLDNKASQLFAPEEEARLCQMFKLSEASLRLVLDSCCFVFEQAAYQGLGADALFQRLVEAGCDEEHAKAFGSTWAVDCAGYISRLKQRTLGCAALMDSDYHINVTVSESSLLKQQVPTALFEFDTGATPTPFSPRAGVDERLCVEFSHPELFAFFEQLERVQRQLDALGGASAASARS